MQLLWYCQCHDTNSWWQRSHTRTGFFDDGVRAVFDAQLWQKILLQERIQIRIRIVRCRMVNVQTTTLVKATETRLLHVGQVRAGQSIQKTPASWWTTAGWWTINGLLVNDCRVVDNHCYQRCRVHEQDSRFGFCHCFLWCWRVTCWLCDMRWGVHVRVWVRAHTRVCMRMKERGHS